MDLTAVKKNTGMHRETPSIVPGVEHTVRRLKTINLTFCFSKNCFYNINRGISITMTSNLSATSAASWSTNTLLTTCLVGSAAKEEAVEL